jgi:hypothetical protein
MGFLSGSEDGEELNFEDALDHQSDLETLQNDSEYK